MNRSVVGAVGVGALLFVLQHVLFVDFEFLGVHPELMLLFAVCCGLAGGPNYGVMSGFFSGLVSDAFMTSPMGLCAFAFGIAGYFAGVASDDTTSTPPATMLTAGLTTAAGLFLVFVAGGIFGGLSSSFGHAFAVIFVASFINALLAVPLRRTLRVIRMSAREPAW